jgi:hypothetical protein
MDMHLIWVGRNENIFARGAGQDFTDLPVETEQECCD